MQWKRLFCKQILLKQKIQQPGVLAALAAALLFGAGTPLAKLLLNTISPWLLAGLLYTGSGLGLMIYRLASRAPVVKLPRRGWCWFAGAIAAGGMLAPVLLMVGLTGSSASAASLLLNTEAVFTALLAWFVFKENVDRRIALGMAAIVIGASVLSWPVADTQAVRPSFAGLWPMLAILGACLAWAVDNNLTRKIALADATWIAAIKGLVAGMVNLVLAFLMGASLPPLPTAAGAMLVGLLAYGVSLTLFVLGLRHLGSARTGAYFSIAPFFGALLAIAFGEPLTPSLLLAGGLMALGLWLHLTERHQHVHTHADLQHEHLHMHDAHHQHTHLYGESVKAGIPHSHPHHHQHLRHSHVHFPDMHHQHRH